MPRVSSSFDITDDQTIVIGVSGAFGPNNTGPTARTSIVGADLYWKWKSPTARQGFPFVSFQTEALARSYDAQAGPDFPSNDVILPSERLKDQGAYFQALWGIKPLLVAGLRAEYATGDAASFLADARADRSRYSPNLTWYPTEFSKLRVQYNFDHRVGIGNANSLWFQIEFLLGAHAAHKF